MAVFQKTMVFKRQDAYDDYQAETTRVDTAFTINTAKNVTKNYQLKNKNCYDTGQVIQPSDVAVQSGLTLLDEYVVIKPDDGTEGDPFVEGTSASYYETLYIMPDTSESRCDPARKPPQVPFVLGARGILFRRRSTPYFTTTSNPEGYIE